MLQQLSKSCLEAALVQGPVPAGTGLLPRSLLTAKGTCHSKTDLVRKDLRGSRKGNVLKT